MRADAPTQPTDIQSRGATSSAVCPDRSRGRPHRGCRSGLDCQCRQSAGPLRDSVILAIWPLVIVSGTFIAWRWLGRGDDPEATAGYVALTEVIEDGMKLSERMRAVTAPETTEPEHTAWRVRTQVGTARPSECSATSRRRGCPRSGPICSSRTPRPLMRPTGSRGTCSTSNSESSAFGNSFLAVAETTARPPIRTRASRCPWTCADAAPSTRPPWLAAPLTQAKRGRETMEQSLSGHHVAGTATLCRSAPPRPIQVVAGPPTASFGGHPTAMTAARRGARFESPYLLTLPPFDGRGDRGLPSDANPDATVRRGVGARSGRVKRNRR